MESNLFLLDFDYYCVWKWGWCRKRSKYVWEVEKIKKLRFNKSKIYWCKFGKDCDKFCYVFKGDGYEFIYVVFVIYNYSVCKVNLNLVRCGNYLFIFWRIVKIV